MKVIMLMAMTLDGKIAKSPRHFPDWTGKADKRLFVKLTQSAGVLIMGSKTFDTIGKPLKGRKNIILTRDKSRKSEWENLVFTDEKPREILDQLEKEGFSEAILAGGAMVNSLFARAGLIDEVVVTVSPKIFGSGISLFTEDILMELELLDVKRPDPGLVCLRYKVSGQR